MFSTSPLVKNQVQQQYGVDFLFLGGGGWVALVEKQLVLLISLQQTRED